jgi:predicted Zn-dependent protease
MPPAANRSGIWKGIAAAALGLTCVAGGWWLGQLQNGTGNTDQARLSLERQASALQQQLNLGQASPADQQRLLELLVGLDRKPEATVLLERLADQQPQKWPLRLLLAELRRDQQDRSGAERELRQLLNLRPDQIEGLQLLALLQLETGRSAQAQKQLEAALSRASKPQLKPQALAIGLLLANVLQKSGRPAQADSVLFCSTLASPGGFSAAEARRRLPDGSAAPAGPRPAATGRGQPQRGPTIIGPSAQPRARAKRSPPGSGGRRVGAGPSQGDFTVAAGEADWELKSLSAASTASPGWVASSRELALRNLFINSIGLAESISDPLRVGPVP